MSAIVVLQKKQNLSESEAKGLVWMAQQVCKGRIKGVSVKGFHCRLKASAQLNVPVKGLGCVVHQLENSPLPPLWPLEVVEQSPFPTSPALAPHPRRPRLSVVPPAPRMTQGEMVARLRQTYGLPANVHVINAPVKIAA